MIARFAVDLETDIYVQCDAVFLPLRELQHGDYLVRIYPPQQAIIAPSDLSFTAPSSLNEIVQGLVPANPPNVSENVFVGGKRAFRANLLCIDFLKDYFVRNRSIDPIAAVDPPLRLVFSIANRVLAGLRVLSRGQKLKPLSETSTFWRVDYLNDQGEQLPVEEALFRTKCGGEFRWTLVSLPPPLWDAVSNLPHSFIHHTWDALLLDAEALLPDVGPAIAVANAALEAFVPWALDQLQESGTFAPPALWHYVFNRDDWYQNPSIVDQLGKFIMMMTGHDLKTEQKSLWEGLRNLRAARNAFSHDGKPMIGKSEVTVAKALKLIEKAKRIVDWVEALLPAHVQRPKYFARDEHIVIKRTELP